MVSEKSGGVVKSAMGSVSVCFPAFNEEATVAGVLAEAHELLSGSGLDYEILVCDDGSSDGTGGILELCERRYPKVRLIRHETNQGIYRTFEDLYAAACKEYVFLNSTDGQWPTGMLFDMLALVDRWDIVIARRKNKHYGLTRSFVSSGFRLVCLCLFGVETYDPGAVKLVRREVIRMLPTVSRTPFVEGERLIRAARAGYRIGEYPVDVQPRRHGKSNAVKMKVMGACMRDLYRTWVDVNLCRE